MSLDQVLKMLDPLRDATDPEVESATREDCMNRVDQHVNDSIAGPLDDATVWSIYHGVEGAVSITETTVYTSTYWATR